MLEEIIRIRHDPGWITNRREQVGLRLKAASPHFRNNSVISLTVNDLQLLFTFYDQLFFSNWFTVSFPGQVRFSVSRRLTKSAGITICPKNTAFLAPKDVAVEIRLGADFFLKYDQGHGPVLVGGLATNNSLQALQLVFEHELCHLIEFVLYHKSSCKGQRFKVIANHLFGHTASTHQLPTYQTLAREQLGISIGDQVAFSYETKQLMGVVSRITKNATVMVPDKGGQFRDRKGQRYTKYYVPLSLLKKT